MKPSDLLNQRYQEYVKRKYADENAAPLDTVLRLHPQDVMLFSVEFPPIGFTGRDDFMWSGIHWRFHADHTLAPQLALPPITRDPWSGQSLTTDH